MCALSTLPDISQLTSVAVHEDGFELTLTASYSMKDQRDPFQPSPITGSRVLSDLTHRRRHMDSESSEDSDVDEDKDSYSKSQLQYMSTTVCLR